MRQGKATDVASRALAAGVAPDDLLKKGFIPGIAEMGDLFERGEVFLPELVLAADAMTGAAEVCNAALPEGEAETKGDRRHRHRPGRRARHRQDDRRRVPACQRLRRAPTSAATSRGDKFIAAAEENDADVIGMSALLTTTMREQTRVIEALKAAGLRDKYKVIVGGGACTQQWADKIGADAYAEDANDGVRKINELMGN